MKPLLILLIFLVNASAIVYAQDHALSANKKETKTGKRRPVNLEECLYKIDQIFPDSIKVKVKSMTEDEFSVNMHMGFGMWMRNHWGLWGNSKLARFFKEKGIFHADDMSGIISTSYYRHLTGKEIDLPSQIQFYQDYWNKLKTENQEHSF